MNKNLKIIYTLADGETEAQIAQTSQSESELSDDIDWRGERGFIDKDKLTRNLNTNVLENSIFYICGPPGMLKAMQKLLDELQIPKDRIMIEEFTGY